jgi:hypothetical protein
MARVVAFLIGLLPLFSMSFGATAGADHSCATDTGTLVLSAGVLRIEGKLDENMLNCARQVSFDSVSRIVVKSTGGITESAIDLGRLVAKRRVPIEVDGVCASACASYLLPAASVILTDPNDLILFHQTRTSMAMLIGSRAWKAALFYRAGAATEAAYYDEMQIDKRLLWYPQYALETHCVRRLFSSEEVPAIGYDARFALAIFSRRILEFYGFRFEGNFADNIPTVMRGLENGEIKYRTEIINGMIFVDREPNDKDEIGQVPDCAS